MCRIEDWRLKILRKTSSIQVWIEDWRFSEKLLQSRSGLKIEDSQKNFFNPGLASHIHIHIYVYKMAPGSNQQPWFAILNSNFEMYSVRVRNVEVYKAQRQLRPIQLKISLVAIQDFTQVKNIRNFAQFWVVVIQLKNQLVIFDILSCMMCEDVWNQKLPVA